MKAILALVGIDPAHATVFVDRARYTCAALFMALYYVYATAGCTFFLMIATGGGLFPGVIVGLLFAAAVVVYDRFLLSQVSINFSDLYKDDAQLPGLYKKNAQPRDWSKRRSYAVRIVITLLIAIVVTDPLVLKMFDAEITAELGRRHADRTGVLNAAVEKNRVDRLTALDDEIASDQKQLEAANKAVEEALAAVTNEREGRGATGRTGNGPVFTLLNSNYTNAVIRQNEAANTLASVLSDKPEKIGQINGEATRQAAENSSRPPPPAGVLDHQDALLTVLRHNLHAFLVCILISLLLVALDLAVLFIKMAGHNSAYEISVAAASRSRLRVMLASSKADEEVALMEVRLRAEQAKRDLRHHYGTIGANMAGGELKGTVYTSENISPGLGDLLESLSRPMAAAVGGQGTRITYDGPIMFGSWEKTFYFAPPAGNTFEEVRGRARSVLDAIAANLTAGTTAMPMEDIDATAFRTFFTATRDLGSISLVIGPLVTARVGDELRGTILSAEELLDADNAYPPREAATIVARIRERDPARDPGRDLSEWMRAARSAADGRSDTRRTARPPSDFLPDIPEIPAPRDDEGEDDEWP
ncbi:MULTISPECIES: DUF4407 domain-containing protein [unclassified Frankia]|uniref:DUF4407 domain-containing protein n=1 Tax=unclassified Frankia TaxID=2632575 RepID=UPI002025ABCF